MSLTAATDSPQGTHPTAATSGAQNTLKRQRDAPQADHRFRAPPPLLDRDEADMVVSQDDESDTEPP